MSGSVLKRTDMILHKTQPLLLFSFFPVFYLFHIDECKDSILTRSWLDNYAHRREESSVFFDDDDASNPRLVQKKAEKTRQHKTLPSTLWNLVSWWDQKPVVQTVVLNGLKGNVALLKEYCGK